MAAKVTTTAASADTRKELSELIKKKAEISVNKHFLSIFFCLQSNNFILG